MNTSTITFLVAFAYVLLFVAITRRLIRRRKHYGPAMAGTVEDLLNNDRRHALEIIIEEKAEARDAEDRDGNLPDLETPRRERRSRRSRFHTEPRRHGDERRSN